MKQLDLDHDDYLKDNQEKNKFKAKHMTEEERNEKLIEQNKMFQKMSLERGTSSRLRVTPVNLENAHYTEEQKKQTEILQNLRKDAEENFDEFDS